MNKGEYNKTVGADGSITLVYWSYQVGRDGGMAKRVFQDQEALDFWWKLNGGPAKFNLTTAVEGHYDSVDGLVAKPTNKEGLRRMAEEQAWLDANAQFRVGDVRRFADGSFHIGNGAEVTIVRVSMDHSHPSGHTAECWNVAKIQYDVAIGYDAATGKATLRWTAYASALHPVARKGSR